MKEMCIVLKPYICKECGNEMLFFKTNKGTLIDYKKAFDTRTSDELYKYLQDKNIRTIKCLVCGKEYIIDWESSFPKQLMDKKALNKFRV